MRTPTYLFLAVLSLLSSPARAWWNSDWTIRKKLTVDTSAEGGAINGPVGTGAVLVRLHDGNFQFASAKEDGADNADKLADQKIKQ